MKSLFSFIRSLHLPRTEVLSVTGAVCLIGTGLFYILSDGKQVFPAVLFLVLFLIVSALCFIGKSAPADDTVSDENTTLLGSITVNMLIKTGIPVVICNINGQVIWMNNAMGILSGKKGAVGVSLSAFCGISLSDFRDGNGEGGIHAEFHEKKFFVRGYPVSFKNKRYFITLWEDESDLFDLMSRYDSEHTVVAYIKVDNLEELSQYAKEGIRATENRVEDVLSEWADSVNGILKEYQSNRYIFLFRSADFRMFKERKFDVLDKIREIRVGESNLSVTVSIGIADNPGDLAAKERIAAEALTMALQRGGDQVVIKNPKGMEFYGGASQSVQNRTKVKARVIANELVSLIARSPNVLIMGHRSADFDCIGAAAAIGRLCILCKVPYRIIINPTDQYTNRCLSRLNRLSDFAGTDFTTDASGAQELVQSDTLCVIVDVNNKNQLEAPGIAEICKRVVYIDHHRKTAEFEEQPLISYIEPSASSTCELVSEILEQALPVTAAEGGLSAEEAEIIYAGILLDTKQFTKNTGVRTFSAALYLRGMGANPTGAQALFTTDLSDFISEAKFESNVVIYRKCIAISCNDSPDNKPSDRVSAAKAADKLLSVEGVKASFALCRIGETIHVSGRSSGEINVQLILEKLGGGGHFDAAATQLTGPVNEALIQLKQAIDAYFAK